MSTNDKVNLFSPHVTLIEKSIGRQDILLYSLLMVVRKDDQVRYVVNEENKEFTEWHFYIFDEHEDIHEDCHELTRPTRSLMNLGRNSYDVFHAYLEELDPNKRFAAKTVYHPGDQPHLIAFRPESPKHVDGTVHLPHDSKP
ncbi:MAG: hypothetical protein RJQ14_02855 [Marinoscillum sp.]